MASQTKTQSPTGQRTGYMQGQPANQHHPSEPTRQQRIQMMSHGQGQVRNPETDRRLKQNKV